VPAIIFLSAMRKAAGALKPAPADPASRGRTLFQHFSSLSFGLRATIISRTVSQRRNLIARSFSTIAEMNGRGGRPDSQNGTVWCSSRHCSGAVAVSDSIAEAHAW